ncbi:hypothetical protein SASPL_137135 [Salvia splendens]|uniref:DUF7032 domain-containing protein n=1 Tax=Salvia splendens TaxID=180675 RepID=A0A8X8WT59_SALSN|nr:hypothetical protein SASPL_137135 [Salvia splendens]
MKEEEEDTINPAISEIQQQLHSLLDSISRVQILNGKWSLITTKLTSLHNRLSDLSTTASNNNNPLSSNLLRTISATRFALRQESSVLELLMSRLQIGSTQSKSSVLESLIGLLQEDPKNLLIAVAQGIILVLVSLLDCSSSSELKEKSVSAIAKISTEDSSKHDLLAEAGGASGLAGGLEKGGGGGGALGDLVEFFGAEVVGEVSKLPPGPTPLPIIGNIHLLGRNPHRSLAKLSRTYGPLMHLKLGSITTIVASSPEIAREILQKHDQTCSSRAVPCVAQAMGHAEASMAWLPVGSQWRKLRKITKEHMFTPQKVNASEPLRQEKLRQLRVHLVEGCGREVIFEEVAFLTALNLISTTLFSVDFASLDSGSSHEERKANVYLGKMLDKFDEIISKRLEERDKSSDCTRKTDLLEVLLDLNQEDEAYLSLHDIKHLLSPERFVGGSVDYKGRDFGLISFGSGRRICPGLPLAHLMVHLMVASMIHEFDWEAQDVDMDDVFGLSLHKARPLKAFPIIKS